MKRIKRHKIKTENKESSYSRENEEHDLAYYIHDRVELMHQVFSVLKYKDLKAMAPESVRNLPIGDLQELCTEELLGISSKRLLATLDGCEPPSDTESSSASPSPDQLETISLDSISSDEEILSQSSKKKKHKHRRHLKSKGKKKEKEKSKEAKAIDEPAEVSQASRAGLTVLELLELQARARAIRAQLQNEQAKKQLEAAAAVGSDDDDDEVEIKEETPDVVEISSGDEKPDINALEAAVQKSPKAKEVAKEIQKEKSKEQAISKETTKQIENPTGPAKDTQKHKEAENKNNTEKTVTTKRINDLIITVPQAKSTRKIKLNRNKVTVTVPTVPEIIAVDNRTVSEKPSEKTTKENTSDKKKKKKTKKKKNLEKEGSDHDEITLQLSDTEKMDLLEDLDDKNYQRVSGSSDSSESSSSDSEVDTSKESVENIQDLNKIYEKEDSHEIDNSELTKDPDKIPLNDEKITAHETNIKASENEKDFDVNHKKTLNDSDKDKTISPDAEENEKESSSQCDVKENPTEMSTNTDTIGEEKEEKNDNLEVMPQVNENEVITEIEVNKKETEKSVELVNVVELFIDSAREIERKELTTQIEKDTERNETDKQNLENEEAIKIIEINKIDDIPLVSDNTSIMEQESKVENENKNKKEISEGELSDRESSEVEAYDVQPEVVCISDDEKQKKKKKKKDKKAKKVKKSKKSKQDFREGADQNFYKDTKTIDGESSQKDDVDKIDDENTSIDLTEDVYEILELSDDSSCYEVEGTCLSKEPTAEEIAALSARIDEIKREDIEQTNRNTLVEDNSPHKKSDASDTEVEQISWKDRYLGSKKVKTVLTTANILNALRKKNKDLKKKIADAKKLEMESQEDKVLEEGSIEHYQTLQASSKYVNPVAESTEEITEEVFKEDKEGEKDQEGVTREMKKDAKLLLKMYRKLMNNKKDKRREKKKKRKMKKKEEVVPETADLI